MLGNFNENYYVDVDVNPKDNETMITIYKDCGINLKFVQCLRGDEADKFYTKLTNKHILRKDNN